MLERLHALQRFRREVYELRVGEAGEAGIARFEVPQDGNEDRLAQVRLRVPSRPGSVYPRYRPVLTFS